MILLTAFLCATSIAGEIEDEVIDALKTQMATNFESLEIPDAQEIYHLRYQLISLSGVDAQIDMGAMTRFDVRPINRLGVEVRVGSPEFDNSGFGGWQNGFDSIGLADDLTPTGVEMAAWKLTDTAFKHAVEQYARKAAQFTPPDDYPGDFTLTGPVVKDLGHPKSVDNDDIIERMRAISSLFLNYDQLTTGSLFVGMEIGERVIIDTEGTDVRKPSEETTLRAAVIARADDGMLVTDELLWTTTRPERLPSLSTMKRQTDDLARRIQEVAAASPLEEEYVGPVIFEGEAALDLFRYLLVPQLEGTPSEIPFNSFIGELGGRNAIARLKRRALPSGFSVWDDPTTHPQHPAAWTLDSEGTEARRVELIEDGIVQSLLMSRIPRTGIGQSNGHARGSTGDRLVARASQLTIEPKKNLSQTKLIKKGIGLAQAYDQEFVIIVRGLQESSILNLTEDPDYRSYGLDDEANATLPPPVSVFKRYADGREEELRGAHFSGVHRWILRDIAATGPQHTGSYLAPSSPGFDGYSPIGGLPTMITAPSVLITELELTPATVSANDKPVLPSP